MMKLFFSLIGIGFYCLQSKLAIAQSASTVSNRIEERARAITVRIFSRSIVGSSTSQEGSGVLVRGNNNQYYIVTNCHVVEQPAIPGFPYIVVFNENSPLRSFMDFTDRASNLDSNNQDGFPGYIVARDNQADLALLQFSEDQGTAYANLAKASNLRERDRVYAAGFPSSGEVSSTVVPWRFIDAVVLDARTSVTRTSACTGTSLETFTYETLNSENTFVGGMSGGPVLNEQGQLVGINKGASSKGKEGRIEQGIPIAIITNRFPSIGSAQPSNGQLPNELPPPVTSTQESPILIQISPSNQLDPELKTPIGGAW